MIKKMSPKITKTRRRGYTSIRCSLVFHYRDPMNGKPTYDTLASFPSVRSDQVNETAVQQEFHQRVDAELLKQILRGAMRNDCIRCKEAFAKVVPVPKLTAKSLMTTNPASVEKHEKSLTSRYPILAKRS